MLANLITLLHSDGFICSAYCLGVFCLGVYVGWYIKAFNQTIKKTKKNSKQKQQKELQTTKINKLIDPERIIKPCPFLNNKWQSIDYELRADKKPKITHTTCEFFKNGICSKNNQTCHLLKGYKKDYFAF